MRRRCLLAVAVGLALAAPSSARAQEIYRLHLESEVPFVVGTLSIAALPQVFSKTYPRASCLPDCDAESVNPLDRWVIGLRSELAETLSNVFVLAIPVLGLGLELADEQGAAFWQDTFVELEAYAVHVLVVTLFKTLIRRPRPYVYDEESPYRLRAGASSAWSFFSGHTSSAFVTAISVAETYRRRHEGWSVDAVYAGGVALASLVGVLRLLAGKHFLTDVLVGALIGTTFGVLMPALHDRDRH